MWTGQRCLLLFSNCFPKGYHKQEIPVIYLTPDSFFYYYFDDLQKTPPTAFAKYAYKSIRQALKRYDSKVSQTQHTYLQCMT